MSEGTQELEKSAQKELRAIAEELRAIEERLRAVHRSLPEPAAMESEDEERMDVATAIRSAIECGLTDSLAPLVRNLEAASAYPGGAQG